jgi:integrase
MPKSTKSAAPRKPHPDFPLFPHAVGQWAKKVKGKLHYFGVWADPQAALEKWLEQKDDLLAGRMPRKKKGDAGTLAELCNRFITTKSKLLSGADSSALLGRHERGKEEMKPELADLLTRNADAKKDGELSLRSWRDYVRVCKALIETFGRDRALTDIHPEDFEGLRTKWATTLGVVRLGNEINRVRIVFNYGYKNGLLDRPMRYGEGFKRPSKMTLRIARNEKGIRMFEAGELRELINRAGKRYAGQGETYQLVEAEGQPLKAMILLGINVGFGNSDVAQLPLSAIDLERGWHTFARPKTGINRRCSLWPETVKAIREWLVRRPTPANEAHRDLVFLTAKGDSWAKATSDNPVSKETRKLLDELGINGYRNFYALRHTLETIGGESKDQPAVDHIMGHASDDMASVYRERISDERLVAVAEHVREWLFGKGCGPGPR